MKSQDVNAMSKLKQFVMDRCPRCGLINTPKSRDPKRCLECTAADAANEMLAELKHIREQIEKTGYLRHVIDGLDATIAKAEGWL